MAGLIVVPRAGKLELLILPSIYCFNYMNAEIISIGDELTSGQRLDTNSQWLSRALTDLGVKVIAHTTIADELPVMVEACRIAAKRCDFAICSGGLGPTADDLTREAIAEAAGVELELDENALAQIERLFARRKRPMPERNRVQAYFPRGSRVIPNPHGSAPGFEKEVILADGASARFFTLPGVPAELTEMWTATVEPRIIELLGSKRKCIRHRAIKCFGVGESDLEAMLPDLIRRGRTPTVGITVSRATITLRISAEAESSEACQQLIDETELVIRGCLGELVFGEDDDELQHAVVKLLAKLNQTICVAEIGTGGLIADWLSRASFGSECFKGGIVARDYSVARQLLAEHGIEYWGDSESEFVGKLAGFARMQFHADFALAIGEFPAGDSATQAPANVHFAICSATETTFTSQPFVGHPDILRDRSAKQLLDLARKALARHLVT